MIYFGCFESREDVAEQFEIKLDDDIEILYAEYDCPPYEGFASVLYRQNEKLYEVHGSHCSCFGLEGQWEPEETTILQLEYIVKNGRAYNHMVGVKERIEEIIQSLK